MTELLIELIILHQEMNGSVNGIGRVTKKELKKENELLLSINELIEIDIDKMKKIFD